MAFGVFYLSSSEQLFNGTSVLSYERRVILQSFTFLPMMARNLQCQA
jgi:hypothetical protein